MNMSNIAETWRNSAAAIVCSSFLASTQLLSTAVHAKDLYVATNGSDSVSYAANNQSNPWRSLDHSLSQIQGGDTLYIRAGTYVPTTRHQANVSGTQSTPTVITSFPGEAVSIDLGAMTFEWVALDGVHYWEFSDLEFVNVRMISEIALTFVSTGHAFRNNRIVMNRGGDNVGAIRLMANARSTIIDGNDIIGPGLKANGINANTSCVHMDRVSDVQVLNNRISNCVVGIHYKHAPSNTGGSGIEYAYNIITDTDEWTRYNGNNGHIHDNIIGPRSTRGTIGTDNGSPGGNNNVFEHNTFAGGFLVLDAAGPVGAVQNNTVINNLFTPPTAPWPVSIDIVQWFTRSHNSVFDWNLHPTAVAVREHNISYTLSAWRSKYGGSANSVEGAPIFQGGANPVTPDDYRITAASIGYRAASDGEDMGARIDLFGTSGLSLVRPNPPQSLTVN